jgi:hypothetical protein
MPEFSRSVLNLSCRLAYIFVRVEEDRVIRAGLTAELVDEGFRLFEGIGTTPRGSFFFLARLLGDGNPIPGASFRTPEEHSRFGCYLCGPNACCWRRARTCSLFP